MLCVKCKKREAVVGPRGGAKFCEICRDYQRAYHKSWRQGGRLAVCICGREFQDYTGREFCSKACAEGAPQTRICRVCGIKKPLNADNFRRVTNRNGGLWWKRDCNDCHNALVKQNRDDRIARNPDEVRAYARSKYARRPELYRAFVRRRQAWKKAGSAEPVDLEAILAERGMVCHICGWDIPSADVLDFDHVHPLARGGAHTADNIAPAHSTCNRWKGARLMSDLDLQGQHEKMALKLAPIAA